MATATILPLTAAQGTVQQLAPSAGARIIEAALTASTAACPRCGRPATRVQRRYWRTLADVPWQGIPVRVRLQVRRFWCDQRTCAQAIFTKQLPTLATRYARKTTRVVAVRTPLAFALGGEGGTRLVTVLGMVASAATLLRLIRRTPVPTRSRLPRIGSDDFARQRGRRYGTIIINLDTHQPMEVLADRRAATVAAWLRAHPEVETSAGSRWSLRGRRTPGRTRRDASGRPLAPAETSRGCPGTGGQPARRSDPCCRAPRPRRAVGRRANGGTRADDQRAPAVVVPVAAPTAALPVADTAPRADGDVRQQERFAAIHALHEAGATVSAIARELGLTRLTVRKYLRASAAPERVRRQGLLGATSPYVAHLRTRWGDGCDHAAVLWAALRAMAFPGSAGVVRRFLGHWRTTPRRPGRQPQATGTVGVVPPVAPPTVRDVRWWLLTAPDQRRPEQHV